MCGKEQGTKAVGSGAGKSEMRSVLGTPQWEVHLQYFFLTTRPGHFVAHQQDCILAVMGTVMLQVGGSPGALGTKIHRKFPILRQ